MRATCAASGTDWQCSRDDIDSHGLCTAHSKQRLRLGEGNLHPLRTANQRPMCTASGDGWQCDRRSKARSLCSAHYNQQLRGNPLQPLARPATPKAVGKPCPVTIGGWACGRPIQGGGMCITHRRQHRAGKPLTRIGAQQTSMCEASGDGWACDQPSNSRGMCRRHALQRDKGREITPHGAPKQAKRGITPQSPRCVQFVGDVRCDRPSKARGLCDHHYRQSRNGVQPSWPMTPAERARLMHEARSRAARTGKPSEPYVPGTLKHGQTGVKATVREVLDVGPVVPPSRAQIGKTVAAAKRLGLPDDFLAELAHMLTDEPRNSEAVYDERRAA